MQIRVNIEFCLCCLFQRLVFSERREMLATDRQHDYSMPRGSAHRGITTDRQRDYSMPRGSAHRGIMTDNAITVCLVAPPTEA